MNPALPPIDDTQIWDSMLSLYNTHAIALALELQVFEAFDAPMSVEELVSKTGYSTRGIKALIAMLKIRGLLDRHEGRYQLNNLSRTYMLKDSPYYWGPFFSWTSASLPNYKIYMENIRDGETKEEREAADGWESGEMDPEFARTITDYMHCHSIASAVGMSQTCDFSGVNKLLDVGGGSGCYAIAIANANTDMQATIMELKPVCAVAEDYIAKAGISDRVDTKAVDMFREAWPEGYDAHFFANVFHDWSFETCAELAKKSYASLAPGGRICLQEMLLDEGEDNPAAPVAFSFLMTWGTKGQQFTLDELRGILESAGFKNIRAQRSYGYYSMVTGDK
ncbi:MAG: methyltransferase [Gammaproteobacteria bacterium]